MQDLLWIDNHFPNYLGEATPCPVACVLGIRKQENKSYLQTYEFFHFHKGTASCLDSQSCVMVKVQKFITVLMRALAREEPNINLVTNNYR